MKPTNKKPVQVNFSSTRYKSSKWILNEILIEFKWIIKGVLWLVNEFYWVIIRLNLGKLTRFTKNVYFVLEKSLNSISITTIKTSQVWMVYKLDDFLQCGRYHRPNRNGRPSKRNGSVMLAKKWMLVTIFWCWWRFLDVGDVILPSYLIGESAIIVGRRSRTDHYCTRDD